MGAFLGPQIYDGGGEYGNDLVSDPGAAVGRRSTIMAVQFWMGLLPERWRGTDRRDPVSAFADGPTVMVLRLCACYWLLSGSNLDRREAIVLEGPRDPGIPRWFSGARYQHPPLVLETATDRWRVKYKEQFEDAVGSC